MKQLFELAIVVFGTCCVQADFIVAPNDRKTLAGDSRIIDGFRNSGDLQLVYGSRNFSSPVEITGIAFRVDESSGGLSFDTVIPSVTIRVSTYRGTFASFNPFSYEANKGSDDFTAYSGPIHWTSTDLPGGTPNPFDLKILFSKPFFYDPSSGYLLMEYNVPGQPSGPPFFGADAHSHGDTTIGWIAGGTASPASLVAQFDVTQVPEPKAYLLLASGVVSIFLAVSLKRS